MKLNKKLLVITTAIILLPVFVGILLWEQLPETMVTHWGMQNEPNGWSSKPMVVFGIPGIMAAMHFFGLLVTFADPKRSNIGQKAIGIVYWITPAVSVLVMGATYAFALGIEVNIGMICCLLFGFILVILGNYLPKAKQNYTFGYKIPWTLNSEENWNRTHRLAGWLMVILGIVLMVNAFFLFEWMFIIMLPIALAPIVYSYILYKKGI